MIVPLWWYIAYVKKTSCQVFNNSRILISKMHLSSLVAEAAVRSKAVIPLFVVASIVCVAFGLAPCFMVFGLWCHFYFRNHLAEEERAEERAETSRTVLAYKTWFCLFSVYRNRFIMFWSYFLF